MTTLPPDLMAAYPIGTACGRMQQPPPCSQWMALQPSAIACDFDFPMQAPCIVDATTSQSQPTWTAATVAIGSFNVLTMRQVGAYVLFAKQMSLHGLAMVGVQEARSQAAGAQVIASDTYQFLVLSGAATSRGTHGCQLWIDMRANWGLGSTQRRIGRQHASILQYSPRHLLVKVRTASLFFAAVVLHGPYAGDENCEPGDFWDRMGIAGLRRLRPRSLLLSALLMRMRMWTVTNHVTWSIGDTFWTFLPLRASALCLATLKRRGWSRISRPLAPRASRPTTSQCAGLLASTAPSPTP